MAFGTTTAARVDVEFVADTGKATADVKEFEAVYGRTTAQLSTETLRMQVAQEKLNRTISRYGPESTQAKEATLRYRSAQESLEHETRQATGAIEHETRELSQLGRGALLGSGAMRGLGRSVAYASTTLLGSAGIVYAIREFINAAQHAEDVQTQLENAVKHAGLTYADYRDQIESTIQAQSKMSSFDDEDLKQTFSTLVRRTGDVTRALQLNALAANVARGRQIPLEAAMLLVIKASLGQAGALRRVGIAADKNATSLQLLALLSDKYGHSAATFADTSAGKQARFNKVLEDSKEIIGTELLPAFNDALVTGSNWLDQQNESGNLQRKVNQLVRDGTQIVHGLADAIQLIHDVGKPAVEVVGGLENAIKLLILAMAIGKVAKFAGAIGLIGKAAGEQGAARDVTLLRTRLLGLGSITIPEIVIPIVIAETILNSKTYKNIHKAATDKLGPAGFLVDSLPKIVSDEIDRGKKIAGAFGIGGSSGREKSIVDVAALFKFIDSGQLDAAGLDFYRQYLSDADYQALLHHAQEHAKAKPSNSGAGSAAVPPPAKPTILGPAGQRAAALAHASTTPGTADDASAARAQIAYDQRALAFLEQRRRQGKVTAAQYLAAYKGLNGDIAQQQGTLTSIAEDAAQAAAAKTAREKAALAKAKAAREKAERAAKAAREKAERERQQAYEAAIRAQGLELRNAVTAQGRLTTGGDVVDQTFAAYPGLAKYRDQFAFKKSPPSPKGYMSESYQPGQDDSFDKTKRAIELYGNKNRPADVAGEIVSHFLAQGDDSRLTALYTQFSKTLTDRQLGWVKRTKKLEGDTRTFQQYLKVVGVPALFRGQLFGQLDSGDVTYTKQQQGLFAQVKKILTTPSRSTAVVAQPPRRSAAEVALLAFYKHEANDKKLSREERARYRQLILQEEQRETAALTKYRTDQDAQAKAQQDLQLQILENDVARARLITDPAKEKSAELKAEQQIIDYWRRRVEATKGLAREEAKGQMLAAQAAKQALNAKVVGDPYTAAQARADAISDLRAYGSTLGIPGLEANVDSPQSARAILGALGTLINETRKVTAHTKATAQATHAINRSKPSAIQAARALL